MPGGRERVPGAGVRDDAGLAEVAKPGGKDAGGDRVAALLELAEGRFPGPQLPQDPQGPPPAEQVERSVRLFAGGVLPTLRPAARGRP
jgi:hypothetical protein